MSRKRAVTVHVYPESLKMLRSQRREVRTPAKFYVWVKKSSRSNIVFSKTQGIYTPNLDKVSSLTVASLAF